MISNGTFLINVSGAKTIKKNTNSTQNKYQTHRAKQYEVTSFLSTDCELSTEICSKNVYSIGPWSILRGSLVSHRDPSSPLDLPSCLVAQVDGGCLYAIHEHLVAYFRHFGPKANVSVDAFSSLVFIHLLASVVVPRTDQEHRRESSCCGVCLLQRQTDCHGQGWRN